MNKKLFLKAEPFITKEENYILVTSFNFDVVKSFHDKFRALNENISISTIIIIISSYGGQVHSLLAMLDIMKTATKPIATIAMGAAMSCGSLLLSAGTKGYRFSGEYTDIMIHEVSSTSYGKATELTADIKHTNKLNKLLFKILATNSNKHPLFFIKEMKKRTNLDWNLTANEAKALGIIDHIGIPNFSSNIK